MVHFQNIPTKPLSAESSGSKIFPPVERWGTKIRYEHEQWYLYFLHMRDRMAEPVVSLPRDQETTGSGDENGPLIYGFWRNAHDHYTTPLARPLLIPLQVVRTSFGFHVRGCMGSSFPSPPPPPPPLPFSPGVNKNSKVEVEFEIWHGNWRNAPSEYIECKVLISVKCRVLVQLLKLIKSSGV